MGWVLGFVFISGFVLGVLAIVAVEVAAVLYFVKRVNRKKEGSESQSNSVESSIRDLDVQQSLDFASSKQGFVWVLECDEGLNNWMTDGSSKEQKRKKEFLEVTPVRKYGRIKDRQLILSGEDDSQTSVQLKGCIVEAVSATGLSSRKWAKRFPIKLERKSSAIYKGSKLLYIYLETSWEKESWCKSLRLASFEDKDRLIWFTKLDEEFQRYVTLLNTGYPSFMKPLAGVSTDVLDKDNKIDISSSKVHLLWKKLSKRTNKAAITNFLGHQDRKIGEKIRTSQDSQHDTGLVKSDSGTIMPDNISEENSVSASSRSVSHNGHVSVASDGDFKEKFYADEGTLSWNLLISRLFFDAKYSARTKNFIQARIQRTLSNMRTPSFIGEIACSDIDTGDLPPYIHGIRVLPMEMNEVWAFEIDIEYRGGAVLDVETRLEVRDAELQKDIVDTSLQPSSVGDVFSDLLEGFKCFGKRLNVPVDNFNAQDQKDEGDAKTDRSKDSTSTNMASTNVSKWKSILRNVAQQVSQVPLSLSIRVASLRGTLRVHLKPPPSDQLWFAFTSMPGIEFELGSSIGDHKITSSNVAMLLANRFKAAIRETLVLPNCEYICIPFMLAEKDDWVPRGVAPFMWLNQEAAGNQDSFHAGESNKEVSNPSSEGSHENQKVEKAIEPKSASPLQSISGVLPAESNNKSLQELKTPLLGIVETQETEENAREQIAPAASSSISRWVSGKEDDESKTKKMGRRARMADLGKKMSEKLEEKRRHLEEKSRNIVEKMRGP